MVGELASKACGQAYRENYQKLNWKRSLIMLKLEFKLLKDTKTCYRFETGSQEAGNLVTLYLKKSDIDAAGIDTRKGITITVKQSIE